MQIYIRRGNEEFGPYTREAALEYLKQEVFEMADEACYAGTKDWKPVSELLGIDAGPKQSRDSKPRRANRITEFNPDLTQPGAQPAAQPRTPAPNRTPIGTAARPPTRRRRSSRGEHKRGWMILLNAILVLIVAVAADIKFGRGGPIARHYLAVLSAELASLANEGAGGSPTPKPAPAPAQAAPATISAASAPPSTPAASPATIPPAPVPAGSPVLASAPTVPVAPAASPAVAAVPAGSVINATPVPGAVAAAAYPPAPPKPFDPADLVASGAALPKTVHLKQPVVFQVIFNSQVAGSATVQAGGSVDLDGVQGENLIVTYNGATQAVPWKETDIQEQVAKLAMAAPRAPATPQVPAVSDSSAPVLAAPTASVVPSVPPEPGPEGQN